MVDGEQEALGVEAVHLDEPVVVGGGSVDDDEDEVVVVLGVLDREGVESEDVTQDLEVVPARPLEVEPEEPPAREELRHLLAAELDLVATAILDHVARAGATVPRRWVRPDGRFDLLRCRP